MLVFVDESGDPGLETEQGASEFFHVVTVIFADPDEALACEQRIDQLRGELGLKPEFEFHFNKLSGELRKKFLQAVASYDWFYLVVTINKKKLWGEGFQFAKSFYKYAVKLVFLNASRFLENATVVIDGRDSRHFRKQLATYLRRQVNVPEATRIAKVKVQRSHANTLLQLADMVVGAVARSYRRDKRDRLAYKRLISHRELHSQVWPR